MEPRRLSIFGIVTIVAAFVVVATKRLDSGRGVASAAGSVARTRLVWSQRFPHGSWGRQSTRRTAKCQVFQSSPPPPLPSMSLRDSILSLRPQLNRSVEEINSVIGCLESNWFTDIEDVVQLTPDEAAGLGVPFRLVLMLRSLLRRRNQRQHTLTQGISLSVDLVGNLEQQAEKGALQSEQFSGKTDDCASPLWQSGSDSSNGGSSSSSSGSSVSHQMKGELGQQDTINGISDQIESRLHDSSSSSNGVLPAPDDTATGGDPPAPVPTQPQKAPQRQESKRVPFKKYQVSKKKQQTYGLTDAELRQNPELKESLASFERFMTKTSYGQLEPPIRKATAEVYIRVVKLALGWLKNHRDVPLQSLSLSHIFSNETRQAAHIAFDYVEFLREENGASNKYRANIVRSLIKLAKFMFQDTAKMMESGRSSASSDDKPYHSLEIIRELRKWHQSFSKDAKGESRSSDERKKWLPWPKYLECVKKLMEECLQTETDAGKPRTPFAIAKSYQTFLILAILACVPDRQRTIRELEIGKTLVKQDDETSECGYKWIIKHGPENYKTGKAYGDRPPMEIQNYIYPYLEDYINDHRHHLLKSPKDEDHKFLFVTSKGDPATAETIYSTVARSTYRLTGQRTNPHLLRDSIVTYLRSTDASEKQLEALALYMGHSLQMQKQSYDRRTKLEKVAPAVQLLHSINSGAADEDDSNRDKTDDQSLGSGVAQAGG